LRFDRAESYDACDCGSHFVRKVSYVASYFVTRTSIGDHPLEEVVNKVRAKLGKLGCQLFDTAKMLRGALAATIGTVNAVAHDCAIAWLVVGLCCFGSVTIDAHFQTGFF
jgi:hypothetical protein